MLFSDQWIIWSPLAGRFLDIHDFLTEEDRVWKQRPTINRLLMWYMLTHSRMTENQAILTARPGPDRKDSRVAQMADAIFKTMWDDTGMLENNDMLMAWLIPGGQAFLKTRPDLEAGEVIQFRGQHTTEEGQELNDVPFDEGGQPLIDFDEQGSMFETGEPFQMNEGGLGVDVLGPLECRGTWDGRPWHKKPEHTHRTYLTPEMVFNTWGVEVEADTMGVEAETSGELQRMLFGSGQFGSIQEGLLPDTSVGQALSREGLVQVTEYWHGPSKRLPEMERQTDPNTGRVTYPGGRLMTVTKQVCLFDGVRPADFRYTSPIRFFSFLMLPGRHQGSTPQEALNIIQRLYNKNYAQVQEHVNLVTNPIMEIAQQSGIQEGDITNEPGQQVVVNQEQGVEAIRFVAPPQLSGDVYQFQGMLLQELQDIGNIEGAEGRVPTSEASGQLVKELRFNSDRFLGPTLRRAVVEYTRMAEDWISWIEQLWSVDKVLTYTGEDDIARHITITDDLFTGKFNFIPDLESMLPEGRGERMARAQQLWQAGAYGDPLSPQAIRTFMEIARFPHMDRAHKPGGLHRETARQENSKLAKGIPATAIVIFPWYDDLIHLETHEEFMASPDFLELDPLTQEQFQIHWQAHHQTMLLTIQQQFEKQLAAAVTQTPGLPGSAGFAGEKAGLTPGANGDGIAAGGDALSALLGAGSPAGSAARGSVAANQGT